MTPPNKTPMETLEEISEIFELERGLYEAWASEIKTIRAELEQAAKLREALENIKLQTEFFIQDGIGENVAKLTLKQIDALVDQALKETEHDQ